jgi:hypothetical protein
MYTIQCYDDQMTIARVPALDRDGALKTAAEIHEKHGIRVTVASPSGAIIFDTNPVAEVTS